MKSIRILDKNINLLGEIDNYEDFIINRRFYNLSEFEFKIKNNKLHTDKLIKNNLIVFDRNYDEVGIILHREFDGVEKQSDTLFIKGVTLKGLINRRLIVPDVGSDYESCEGSQETIIKYFVNKNCINPISEKRKINRLIIANDKNRGNEDLWRSSYDNLSDKIKEICEFCELGWNVTLDPINKQFIFDVIEGKDLTVNQNINPPVIFRSDFNNISNRHYIDSIMNSKNIIYAGTKEDATKLILSFGESCDFDRMEVFTSISSDDVEVITKEGNVKLKEYGKLETFELEINPTNTFIYKKDYNLGDTVTIQDRSLKITMDSKIVEIQETHNKNCVKLKVTFGNSIPNILTKVNKLEKKVM